MYGAVVELDTLADTNRSGAKHQNLFLRPRFRRLVFASIYGIVVGRSRFKFRRTGVNHLKRCDTAVLITHIADFFFRFACQVRDHIVWEFDAFCLF